ncbi:MULTISPECIES: hypothetical protein [Streptomyces]|uniref:hypothetical protein n=1 Tax=Streptomyces TaxID=1883 RepID=UPI001EFA2F87|nr:hypothetical protein [Streptomyces sp. CL12-4]
MADLHQLAEAGHGHVGLEDVDAAAPEQGPEVPTRGQALVRSPLGEYGVEGPGPGRPEGGLE